jgi:HTH-type transcriptional regulator / antitoxin HipB
MPSKQPKFGVIHSPSELGETMRDFRKNHQLTLEDVSNVTNLSMRFLSEVERGKETAEIGKVLQALNKLGLEVIIQPRKFQDKYK